MFWGFWRFFSLRRGGGKKSLDLLQTCLGAFYFCFNWGFFVSPSSFGYITYFIIHVVIFVGCSRLGLSKGGGSYILTATYVYIHTIHTTYVHTYIIIIIRQPKDTEGRQLSAFYPSCKGWCSNQVMMGCDVLHRMTFVYQTSILMWKPLYGGKLS
jgi:hypothetical protein